MEAAVASVFPAVYLGGGDSAFNGSPKDSGSPLGCGGHYDKNPRVLRASVGEKDFAEGMEQT